MDFVIKFFRKRPRKTKTFISSYMSGVLPGYILSLMASTLLKEPIIPTWETDVGTWISISLVGLTCIILFYIIKKNRCSDQKDKNNFHNNFMMNIIITIPIIFFLIFDSLMPLLSFYWWIAVIIFLLYSGLAGFLYIKYHRN